MISKIKALLKEFKTHEPRVYRDKVNHEIAVVINDSDFKKGEPERWMKATEAIGVMLARKGWFVSFVVEKEFQKAINSAEEDLWHPIKRFNKFFQARTVFVWDEFTPTLKLIESKTMKGMTKKQKRTMIDLYLSVNDSNFAVEIV